MARVGETRQKICEHAKKLFNEEGYKNVSLREIAEMSGTSIGNLTHHFPKKENLILAIQNDLHTQYADEFFQEQRGDTVLFNLNRSFKNAHINRENSRFYYKYLIELCNDSKAILKNNQKFRNRLYDFYLRCFTQLGDDGLMRSDLDGETYQTLAYTIVVLTTLWIQNNSPYYDEALPQIDLESALKKLVYPYYTELGREKLRSLNV